MNRFNSRGRIDSIMATIMFAVLPAFLICGMYDMSNRPTPKAALQIAKAHQMQTLVKLASANKSKTA